ncbi:MAG: glycosyltransferase family 4 protein [Alphaproteobacteria bacterium]|nr:glycosyltransferase family 4 protein [Alphaproteobacteria bacterium]
MNVPAGHSGGILDIAFVGTLPPCQTGASIVCLQLLDGFARCGHRVRALAPITPEFETAGAAIQDTHTAINLRWFPMPSYEPFPNRPPPLPFRLEERRQIESHFGQLLRDERPDVVIIGRETYAWIATEHVRTAGVPSVLYVHGGASTAMARGSYPKSPQAELLSQYRAADRIVTMASHWAKTLHWLGLANVISVRNPVALDRFAPGPCDLSLRHALALQDNAIVVLHASHLGPVKRCHDIIRSAAQACPADDRLVYVFVGDGQGLADLKQFSEEQGVSERCRFVGWVSHGRMPAYLNLADLVVMPSEAEVQSLVYLEAMACERVLVASDIPAAREILDDGESGLLFPGGAVDRLTNLTLALASSADRRAEIGRNARRRVAAHGLESVVADHERILLGIVHARDVASDAWGA